MKIDLGYNAGISVYNSYNNETTLEIEDDNLLPRVLVESLLMEYDVEPFIQHIPIEYLQEIFFKLKELYSDELNIEYKIEKLKRR